MSTQSKLADKFYPHTLEVLWKDLQELRSVLGPREIEDNDVYKAVLEAYQEVAEYVRERNKKEILNKLSVKYLGHEYSLEDDTDVKPTAW